MNLAIVHFTFTVEEYTPEIEKRFGITKAMIENEDDEWQFVTAAFHVLNRAHDDVELNDLTDSDDFANMISRSEELYGVHDVGFHPDLSLFGYNSYKVEHKNFNTVIGNLKAFFDTRNHPTSNIIWLVNEDDIEKAYEREFTMRVLNTTHPEAKKILEELGIPLKIEDWSWLSASNNMPPISIRSAAG